MQGVFVTGPARIYIGFFYTINKEVQLPPTYQGNGKWVVPDPVTISEVVNQFAYLGTCELSPDVQERGFYEPVFNSLSGTKVPYDELYQGEDAIISMALTRYSEPILQLVKHRSSRTKYAGQTQWGDIGSMLIGEGRRVAVAIEFPYANKVIMKQGGLPTGLTFVACKLIGPDGRGPLNTNARKPSLVFHATPVTIPGTGSLLYVDSLPNNLPAPD